MRRCPSSYDQIIAARHLRSYYIPSIKLMIADFSICIYCNVLLYYRYVNKKLKSSRIAVSLLCTWIIFQILNNFTLYRATMLFIQYFARIWPWYSLRGLHIRISWLSLYGIRIPLFSLYGIHMSLFPYMVILPIVLVVALLWATMDSPLSQGPLLRRHNNMTVIVTTQYSYFIIVTMLWPEWNGSHVCSQHF